MTCCVLLQSDTTEDDRRLSNTAVDILGHLAQDQRPESQQVFSRDSLGQAFSVQPSACRRLLVCLFSRHASVSKHRLDPLKA